MTTLFPLTDWLNNAPGPVIACGADGAFTKTDLDARISYWAAVLPAQQGQRWAVYHKDSAEFLSLLMALWQLGCTACIPGDNRSATCERLRLHVDGFVGDFPDYSVHYPVQAERDCVTRTEWLTLDGDFPALEIYTSGSTGEPQAIGKTIAELDFELASLETLWPEDKDAVVISTVTHQHFYGLIFRLLWPLTRGQRFFREQCQYTEDVFNRARLQPSFVLISTPSHLGRINTSVAWSEVAERCRSVLSSAAPLSREHSLLVANLLKAPVREIYGSSETGAIAWRVQSETADGAWEGIPGVALTQTESSLLRVDGKHVGESPFDMADRVEFVAGGRFQLLGRIDRIVKVEGKRVSLTEVEREVQRSEFIAVAKAVVITRKRTELALVAELTAAGRRELALIGKRKLQRQLRQHLENCFEPVLLPRRWRFVEQLPYNSQGKLPMDRLQALFDQAEVKWPELLRQTVDNNRAEMVCRIPAELIYFDGHFSGNPILPGIAQIHWAEHYGRRLLNVEGRFDRLEVVKFQQVIFPESTISLALEHHAETRKLSFRFYSDKGVHSSGRICFN
ncbi:acyl-CoA synthetase [Amphritea atlantica]|uniref:Acyl-CoA synthetase n=1 Tax=Amphritea atlantica TaxID=355243 RepID=A0ABY5GWR6_9GAMM|nr:acyl-CoA synthetase [Amphritea atlantica]